MSNTVISLTNDADPTKKAALSLASIGPSTNRSFTRPNNSSEPAILAFTQTLSGNKTFSGALSAFGAVTVSAASATIGTAIKTATYGMGSEVTTIGGAKTVILGTCGAAGSTTVVKIDSATAGGWRHHAGKHANRHLRQCRDAGRPASGQPLECFFLW